MTSTGSLQEFGREIIRAHWMQGSRLGWVTGCFSNKWCPASFLRGPPEVTKNHQACHQQMYIWITEVCTSPGECGGAVGWAVPNAFIQGGTQSLSKWTSKWTSARKCSPAQERDCLYTYIVRPVLGTLIYQYRLSQNSWALYVWS